VIRSGCRSSSAVGGSARKSDPVSMHAKREAQWASDSFLTGSPRRNLAPSTASPSTAAPSRIKSRTIKSNSYVVPTSRRRDALVWETRLRMRQAQLAGTKPKPQRAMVPNTFVPPTDKRRSELRWQVRTEMAWVA